MTTSRLASSTFFPCFTTILICSVAAHAELITMQIDSDQSMLQLSMPFENVDGETLHLLPQAPGTLTAHFTGTATVDVTADKISVLLAADAITFPDSFYPRGPSLGPEPADLAGQVIDPNPDNTHTFYAVRNMLMEIGSFPTTLEPTGSFSVSQHVVIVHSDRWYFGGSLSPDGSTGSGYVGSADYPIIKTNAPSMAGSFEQIGDQYILTIPVQIPWNINSYVTSLRPEAGTFQGQIVAVATVPEPSTFALACMALVGGLFVWRVRVSR